MNLNHAPDLRQRPPRSPRVRLGGYVGLQRILDKGRAEIAGTAGEFKYNNPGDYHWFRFTGVTPKALRAELATGKRDGEISPGFRKTRLTNISLGKFNNGAPTSPEREPDSGVETLQCLPSRIGKFNKAREIVKTWFDLLDLDDHVTFGKA